MAQNFFDISKNECLNVYPELIENSDRHFKVARLLSEENEYGIAISHLILGTEELVKGLIIYLDGEGLQIRKVKGVKIFFYRHSIRHFFSGLFTFLSITLKPFMQIIERFKNLIHNPEMRESMSEFETAVLTNDKLKTDKITQDWLDENGEEYVNKFETYLNFWTDAELTKQRGFYVDYDEKLNSPKHLNYHDYTKAFEITQSFCVDCKALIKFALSISEKDKEKIVKWINTDKRLYNQLADFINENKK